MASNWGVTRKVGGITFTGQGSTTETARRNLLVKLKGAVYQAKKVYDELQEAYEEELRGYEE